MSHALSGQQLEQVYFLSEAQWQQARCGLRFDYIVVGGGLCALAFADRILKQRPHAAILMLDNGGSMDLGACTSWCPRPTSEEMAHWPPQTILAAQANFVAAERLLNVVRADRIDNSLYGTLQHALQDMLADHLGQVESATRSMAAPLALGFGDARFGAAGPLLALVQRQQALAQQDLGSPLRIVTSCKVTRLRRQDGRITLLDTTRGSLEVGDAKLILATANSPAAALLMDAYPEREQIGQRYSGHFLTTLVARLPRASYSFGGRLSELELAALYLAGRNKQSGMQYHVQLTALADRSPLANGVLAQQHLPDTLAPITLAQQHGSAGHIVFTCAVLGELDYRNPANRLQQDGTPEWQPNATDHATWDTMDDAAFQLLELALCSGGTAVEYWHENEQMWRNERPAQKHRRHPGLLDEGSALWIGDQNESPVGLDYRPHGVDNVYVTGSTLWPAAGSWNPTLAMAALSQDLADGLLRKRH